MKRIVVWLLLAVFHFAILAQTTNPNYLMPPGKTYTDPKSYPNGAVSYSAQRLAQRATRGDDSAAAPSYDAGAFRIGCGMSHVANDDPIVWPGRPGKSHLHMFFANNKTRGTSDLVNMATSGNSSCHGGWLNRSGYWVPALIRHCPTVAHGATLQEATDALATGCDPSRDGEVVIPHGNLAYYKGHCCTATQNDLIVWPAPGMRMIHGDPNNRTPSIGATRFDCNDARPGGLTYSFDHIPTKADVLALGGISYCSSITQLLSFGTCWNGELDSPDHKSHVQELVDPYGTYCPDPAYPYIIPAISYNVHYELALDDFDQVRLSSDPPKFQTATTSQPCGTAQYNYCAGVSNHGDWVNGWDMSTLFFGYTLTDHILQQCISRRKAPQRNPWSDSALASDCHEGNIGYIDPTNPNANWRLY